MIDLKPYKGQIQAIAGYKAHGVSISGSELTHTGDTNATSIVDVTFAANEIAVGDIIIASAMFSTDSANEADIFFLSLDAVTAGQRFYAHNTAGNEQVNITSTLFVNSTTTMRAFTKWGQYGTGGSDGQPSSYTVDITSGVVVKIGGVLITGTNTLTVDGYHIEHIKAY